MEKAIIKINGISKEVTIDVYRDGFGLVTDAAFLYKFATGTKLHKGRSVKKYNGTNEWAAARSDVFNNKHASLVGWWDDDKTKSGWS